MANFTMKTENISKNYNSKCCYFSVLNKNKLDFFSVNIYFIYTVYFYFIYK